jgi:hypothetical protein
MRLRWNTTLGLIVMVAGSAVVAAVAVAITTAIYGGRDNPLLGLGLVLASVGALASVKMARELAPRRADRERLSRWVRARLLLESLGFALLTIGLSGLAFLVVFGMLTDMRWDVRHVTFDGLRNLKVVMVALIVATLAGLGVAFLVRRGFNADLSRRRRIARLLAPLAIVVLLVWGETMREIVVYRLEQHAKHDELVPISDRLAGDTDAPGSQSSELAKYHALLSRKWEYFAWRPWFAVEADPPEPKRTKRRSMP